MPDPTRQLDWTIDPLQALRRWPADQRVMLLHSGRPHERWARRTIMALPTGTYRFDPRGAGGRGHGQWLGPTIGQIGTELFGVKPFRDLRTLMKLAGDGLWIGYLSYDLGRWVEDLPSLATDDRGWPVIELAYCPGYLEYDLMTRRWRACGSWARADAMPFDPASLPALDGAFHASDPQSIFSRPRYEAAVARAMKYIAAGDIFQVNLAQRFTAHFEGEYPLAQRAIFAKLAAVSPAWYGAYLELDATNGEPRVIASTSPELFLETSSAGDVITRPIKGTRPASVDARELLESEKDAAELNMIVDLLRNDLGRVCAYGSMRVAEPRVIESHPTVHHGVATITGKLHPSRDIVDLLRATLPGGSITGAPKVRAMQIIDELEPVRRGPYCGCIGWLSQDAMCMNIAIRTMLLDAAARRVDFSVGGGIVADSSPAGEYDETIAKAQAMLRALRT